MNLTETRKALAEYDASEAARQRRWDAAQNDDDVEACCDTEWRDVKTVQDAFWRDCIREGIPNSREHCAIMGLTTLRDWVATHVSP